MATPTPPPVEPGGDTLVQPGRRVVVEQGPPLRPYPWWLWLLAAAFLVFALVFLVLWLLERGPRTRDVPNIVGEPVTQAQHDALTRGFALKVVRRAASQPAGTVLDQAPQPGAALERRATMMAVVSSGAAQAAVPDVVGLKLAAAQKVLSTARFVVQSTVVASTKPQGTVLSQDPPAGSRVARGSNVTLTVARGRALVAVPALQGLTEENAVVAIRNAGLVRSKVRINVSQGTSTSSTTTLTVPGGTQTTVRTRTVSTTVTTATLP